MVLLSQNGFLLELNSNENCMLALLPVLKVVPMNLVNDIQYFMH